MRVHDSIRIIILGSFNPGEPDMTLVPNVYIDELRQIFSTKKYRRFSQVKNFYDRPPNRFWGVMDRIDAPHIYTEYGQKLKNPQGLKYYRGGDRDNVYQRQQGFCLKNGIFISDVVKAIKTTNFESVYNNFSDTIVDKWATEFNTNHLIEILQANRTTRVLFNLKESKATPNITYHLALLKAAAGPERIHWLPSTSGAAGNVYEELTPYWKNALCFVGCTRD